MKCLLARLAFCAIADRRNKLFQVSELSRLLKFMKQKLIHLKVLKECTFSKPGGTAFIITFSPSNAGSTISELGEGSPSLMALSAGVNETPPMTFEIPIIHTEQQPISTSFLEPKTTRSCIYHWSTKDYYEMGLVTLTVLADEAHNA